jgi:hypothetical protein
VNDERMIFLTYDADQDTLRVEYGDGEGGLVEPLSGVMPATTCSWTLGGGFSASFHADCIIKRCAVFEKVLSDEEHRWLHNNGSYRAYADVTEPSSGTIGQVSISQINIGRPDVRQF